MEIKNYEFGTCGSFKKMRSVLKQIIKDYNWK
jgi:hypothetical protein